ncbi:hypothetical protein COOONC_12154, partial [Cooperia oncophora]
LRRVVSQAFRKVFNDAHSALRAGHFGSKKVLRELSGRVFWENMARDVRLWTEECKKCTLFNARQEMTPPLKPVVSTEPFEMIGIDILEMGPTSNGNKYILSVIDRFTKFGGAAPSRRNPRKRVDVGDPRFDPLHLLHPCQCGMFNTRAQVGLPGLRCDLARSKPVKNLYELANVASIALHPHWGDDREETELLNKDSRYLTIHGLATAIQAHAKFCYKFAAAVKEKEGVELSHPPLFTTNPGYDIEMYYRMAMARRAQITSQSPE